MDAKEIKTKQEELTKRWRELGLPDKPEVDPDSNEPYFRPDISDAALAPLDKLADEYVIQGLPTPKAVTSLEQADHYMELIVCLRRRGNLTLDESEYIQTLMDLCTVFSQKEQQRRNGL